MKNLNYHFVWIVEPPVAQLMNSMLPFEKTAISDLLIYKIEDPKSLFFQIHDRVDALHVRLERDLEEFEGRLLLEYADNINNVCVVSKQWPPKPMVENYKITIMQMPSADQVARIYAAYTDKGGES